MKALLSSPNQQPNSPAPTVSQDALEEFWWDVVGQTGTYQSKHESIAR